MRISLERKGITLSKTTVFKYMNKEMGLLSTCRRKRPGYRKGQAHKIFPNLINQDLKAMKRIKTGKWITSKLAIRTLEKALYAQKTALENLILHSDQGNQFTSLQFILFCQEYRITQSMNRAGCPYDNAPMERYYNSLKNELINRYYFRTDEEVNKVIAEYAYVWYNQVRPHSFNDYRTPFETTWYQLDEPTTDLDPQTWKGIWNTIKRLQSNNGMTVFLTIHYMEEATESDYVIVIDHGTIVAKGTPSELRTRYSSDTIRLFPSNQIIL